MGDKPRNPDRTDPLHSLSRAIARGASQILQSQLLHRPPLEHEPAKRSLGGYSCRDGDPLDLTHRCEICGDAIPATSCRREYCTDACQAEAKRRRRRARNEEARLQRRCLFCGGPMTPGYKGRMYCSRTCAEASARDQAGLRRRRACAQCGKVFRPGQKVTRFCSPACYHHSLRLYQARACASCETPFVPKRPDQRFCGRACSGLAHRALSERACAWCGSTFRPQRASRKYCSRDCSVRGNTAGHANLKLGAMILGTDRKRLSAARFDAMFGV